MSSITAAWDTSSNIDHCIEGEKRLMPPPQHASCRRRKKYSPPEDSKWHRGGMVLLMRGVGGHEPLFLLHNISHPNGYTAQLLFFLKHTGKTCEHISTHHICFGLNIAYIYRVCDFLIMGQSYCSRNPALALSNCGPDIMQGREAG